jgi:hypothetical protein
MWCIERVHKTRHICSSNQCTTSLYGLAVKYIRIKLAGPHTLLLNSISAEACMH